MKFMKKQEKDALSVAKRKPYQKPKISVVKMESREEMMIAVSGTTTPEESQAKQNDIWSDEEDDLWNYRSKNLWDDEE